MRSLEPIEQETGEIANRDLSRRVDPPHPRTELARLASSLSESSVQTGAFADRSENEDPLRRFVADASHELRTPLASIRGYAEAFRLGAMGDPATLERAMGRIEAEAVRMGVLVEDLLQLARLDEPPEQRRLPVDLCELAEDAAHDTRAVAPTRNIQLAADGPAIVLADLDQIRQVLANLISNVLIHTSPDSPIELRAYHERGHAALEVRDHGPGLPADAGDRVFDRFWRAPGGTHRGRGGAGLASRSSRRSCTLITARCTPPTPRMVALWFASRFRSRIASRSPAAPTRMPAPLSGGSEPSHFLRPRSPWSRGWLDPRRSVRQGSR